MKKSVIIIFSIFILLYITISMLTSKQGLNQKVITIVSYEPNLSAMSMEKSVTNVLEQKIKNQKDIIEMQSDTYNHFSVIKLSYPTKINLNNKLVSLKETLSNSLPTIRKTYYKYDITKEPDLILEISLAQNLEDKEKRKQLNVIADSIKSQFKNKTKHIENIYLANTYKDFDSYQLQTQEIFDKNSEELRLYNSNVYINKLEATSIKNHQVINPNFQQHPEYQYLDIFQNDNNELKLKIPYKDTYFKLHRKKNQSWGSYYVQKIQNINHLKKSSSLIDDNSKSNLFLFLFKDSNSGYIDFEKSVEDILNKIDTHHHKIKTKTVCKTYVNIYHNFRLVFFIFFLLLTILGFIKSFNRITKTGLGLFFVNTILFLIALHSLGNSKTYLFFNFFLLLNILLFLIVLLILFFNYKKRLSQNSNKLCKLIYLIFLVILSVSLIYFILKYDYRGMRNQLIDSFYYKIFSNEHYNNSNQLQIVSNEFMTFTNNDVPFNFMPGFTKNTDMIFNSGVFVTMPNYSLIHLLIKPVIIFERSSKKRFNTLDYIQIDLISNDYSLLDSVSQNLNKTFVNNKSTSLLSPNIISDLFFKVYPYYKKIYNNINSDFILLPDFHYEMSERPGICLLAKEIYFSRYKIFNINDTNTLKNSTNLLEIETQHSLTPRILPSSLTDLEQLPYSYYYHTNDGIKKEIVKLKDFAKVEFAGEIAKNADNSLGSIQIYSHINQKRSVRHLLYLNPFITNNDYLEIEKKLTLFVKNNSGNLGIKIKKIKVK